MPMRSKMLILAPVKKHWIHRRKKLKKMTRKKMPTRSRMAPRMSQISLPSHQLAANITDCISRLPFVDRFIVSRSLQHCESKTIKSGLSQISWLHVGQVRRLIHLADDNSAGLDLDAAHPLARLDPGAFADGIDAAAVEFGHSRRTQGGQGFAVAATQLFQFQIDGHICQRLVFVLGGQEKAPAQRRFGPVM